MDIELLEVIEGETAPKNKAYFITPCPYKQHSGRYLAHVGSGYCHYKCPYNCGIYYTDSQHPAVRVTCNARKKMKSVNIL